MKKMVFLVAGLVLIALALSIVGVPLLRGNTAAFDKAIDALKLGLTFENAEAIVYGWGQVVGYFGMPVLALLGGLVMLIFGFVTKFKKGEYEWLILAVSFLMVFTCLGFCSSNKSLYLEAITKALGIDRGLFSINDTCRYVTSALINFFFGALVAKFGIRKLVAFGFTSLISSMLIYAYATNIFVFYIGGCLLGLGLAFTTTAMASVLVKRWFKGNTGTVLGVVLAANGLGGAMAVNIVDPIISSHEFGYRDSYTMVAIILLVIGVFAVLTLREKPKNFDGELVVKNKKKVRGGGWTGMSMKSSITRGYFIPACIGIFLTGMVLSGVNGVGGAHLKDKGLGDFVKTILSVHSLVLLVSKALAGILYDRKGLRFTLTMCLVTGSISTTILVIADPSPMGLALAMGWGILSSFALPMETIGVSLVTGDLFGNKCFDKMLGIMLALNHLGYAVGSMVMNFFFELSGGTYDYVMLVMGGILLGVTIMYQFIITAAHRQRKRIEAMEEADV